MGEMKEIKKADSLIAASARQGIQMSYVEASLVLGYLESHDYLLLLDESHGLHLHDQQDGEKHDDDTDETIRDIVSLCLEINGEILLEKSGQDPETEDCLDLLKDEYILTKLHEKAKEVQLPTIREYEVIIIEQLKKSVIIEAASRQEAKQTAEENWKDGDYILDAECFAGVTFLVK